MTPWKIRLEFASEVSEFLGHFKGKKERRVPTIRTHGQLIHGILADFALLGVGRLITFGGTPSHQVQGWVAQ